MAAGIVLEKKYVYGAWLPVHPPPEFVQSPIDFSVMPIFNVEDIHAPDWVCGGLC